MKPSVIEKINKFEKKERRAIFYLFFKIAFPIFFLFLLIYTFNRFDVPVNTGEVAEGEVFYIGKSQTGYRSVTVINSATVRLDNGDVEYISGGDYRLGGLEKFDVLKRKITGRIIYRHKIYAK